MLCPVEKEAHRFSWGQALYDGLVIELDITCLGGGDVEKRGTIDHGIDQLRNLEVVPDVPAIGAGGGRIPNSPSSRGSSAPISKRAFKEAKNKLHKRARAEKSDREKNAGGFVPPAKKDVVASATGSLAKAVVPNKELPRPEQHPKGRDNRRPPVEAGKPPSLVVPEVKVNMECVEIAPVVSPIPSPVPLVKERRCGMTHCGCLLSPKGLVAPNTLPLRQSEFIWSCGCVTCVSCAAELFVASKSNSCSCPIHPGKTTHCRLSYFGSKDGNVLPVGVEWSPNTIRPIIDYKITEVDIYVSKKMRDDTQSFYQWLIRLLFNVFSSIVGNNVRSGVPRFCFFFVGWLFVLGQYVVVAKADHGSLRGGVEDLVEDADFLKLSCVAASFSLVYVLMVLFVRHMILYDYSRYDEPGDNILGVSSVESDIGTLDPDFRRRPNFMVYDDQKFVRRGLIYKSLADRVVSRVSTIGLSGTAFRSVEAILRGVVEKDEGEFQVQDIDEEVFYNTVVVILQRMRLKKIRAEFDGVGGAMSLPVRGF